MTRKIVRIYRETVSRVRGYEDGNTNNDKQAADTEHGRKGSPILHKALVAIRRPCRLGAFSDEEKEARVNDCEEDERDELCNETSEEELK
jgi:hypothetical protein